MGNLANRGDPDEKSQKETFHQGLHCLPRQKLSSEKEIQYYLEIISCDQSIYTIDHQDETVSSFMTNSIGLQRNRENMYKPFRMS